MSIFTLEVYLGKCETMFAMSAVFVMSAVSAMFMWVKCETMYSMSAVSAVSSMGYGIVCSVCSLQG